MLLDTAIQSGEPLADAVKSLVGVAMVFGAIANIGIVFAFLSKVHSATKINAAHIAESKVRQLASEKQITMLQIELARIQGRGESEK